MIGAPSTCQAPTTLAERRPSKRARFVLLTPMTAPISAHTLSNTSEGSGLPATSVATLRSAACSEASASSWAIESDGSLISAQVRRRHADVHEPDVGLVGGELT